MGTPNIRRLLLAFVIVSLSCASSAWASITACGTAGAGNSGAFPATLAAINAANSTLGCEITDLQFKNYTVGGTAGTGGTLPTTANLDMTGDAAGTIATDESITGLSATYAPTATWTAPGGDATYSSQFDGVITVDATYPQDPSPHNFVLSGISLSLGTLGGLTDTGSTITVTENFCLGGTSAAAAGGALTCTAADEASIVMKEVENDVLTDTCTTGGFNGTGIAVTCSGTDPTITSLLSIGRFTTATTQTIVAIDDAHVTTPVTLSDLTEGFDEEGAPEPSTFVLFGGALAAVGLLRLRARRKA